MEGTAGDAPAGVRRLVYRELLPGDYRKLMAESNDSPSGGGARDLRLPYSAFDGIFARLLPDERTELRRRGANRVEVKLRTGPVMVDFAYPTDAVIEVRTEEMVWENPTDARGSEGRIAKVHAGRATAELLTARDPDKGKAFALFVQDDNGELRVHYAFEADLRAGEWADAVATPILTHIDGERRHDRAVQGYIDFPNNFWYAHGLA